MTVMVYHKGGQRKDILPALAHLCQTLHTEATKKNK